MDEATSKDVLRALYVWHDAFEASEGWWWEEESADRILAVIRQLERSTMRYTDTSVARMTSEENG
jgi:hypothetical protein